MVPLLANKKKASLQAVHTSFVNTAIDNMTDNRILNYGPPPINDEETYLTRRQRPTVLQLRSGYCKLLNSYKDTRYEQSFRHNKHMYTYQKLLQTKTPGTIIKFIANYIKGRNTYTTYRNHTSSQRQFKTGVPQGGVLSPTRFNIYTTTILPPRAPFQVMAYADNITITSTHTNTSSAKEYIQPYLHKVFAWTKQNNLTLNPEQTSCILFTTDPTEYKNNLDLKINNTTLPMATHPNVLGLTLDPKLTNSTQIHNSLQAHKPLQRIKALKAIGCDKQKKTLMATYKAIMRPALEYSSSSMVASCILDQY